MKRVKDNYIQKDRFFDYFHVLRKRQKLDIFTIDEF